MNIKNLLKRNETIVILIIIALSLVIQMKSGLFFSSNNLVDLARSLIVPGMMAAGLFMVIASGNIDVSFPYTAMLCMFAVTKLFEVTNYQGPVILGFLIAAVIGALCGAINGVLAAWLNLEPVMHTAPKTKFDPARSVKNTQVWKNIPGSETEIAIIEKDLTEYLYPFPSEFKNC